MKVCSLLWPYSLHRQGVGFGNGPKEHRAAGGAPGLSSSLEITPLSQGRAKAQTVSIVIDGVLQGAALLCWNQGQGVRQ